MPDLNSLDIVFFGNPASRWILAGVAALVLFTALTAARALVLRRTRAGAQADPASWEATVNALAGRVWTLFLLLVALFAGTFPLEIPEQHAPLIAIVMSIAVLVQAALIGDELVRVYSDQYVRRQDTSTSNVNNAISLIQFAARTAVWALASLVILDNLGIDVTALVAGLGIGGIAIALAAQNILGDLFASLAIILDKPFMVGDFIVFGDDRGTVERIGIKTTRIRSITGEQLICANADLLSSRVRNMRRMRERRVLFRIGIVYETPHDKLERVPAMFKEVVESEERARFERAHFAAYGDFSLDFEVVYWVLSPEYAIFMDVQQSIYFKIFKRFEDEGIGFAYPTRTVIVASRDAAAAAAAG